VAFHTYVTTSAGRQIDIGRAQFLFDRNLACAVAASHPRDDQVFWNAYCRLHLEQHGSPFAPDVSHTWE
jgi:hypothetical protein